MFLKSIDLTTALRPSYLPDEVLLFVQDNVGLYEGYVIPRTVASLSRAGARANMSSRVLGNTNFPIIRMARSI